MFRPYYGKCKCHNDTRLIVVKAGYCKQGNEEKKKASKQKVTKEVSRLLKKIPTIQSLINELDEQFSIFIRKREANQDGITKCFTCGAMDHWKNLDCGHYHSRRHYSIRWHEKNCAVQCTSCNIFKEGNKPVFTVKLIEKHGIEVVQLLDVLKNNTFKLERFNLQLLINHYKQLNK